MGTQTGTLIRRYARGLSSLRIIDWSRKGKIQA
jgi:hypothetical protein